MTHHVTYFCDRLTELDFYCIKAGRHDVGSGQLEQNSRTFCLLVLLVDHMAIPIFRLLDHSHPGTDQYPLLKQGLTHKSYSAASVTPKSKLNRNSSYSHVQNSIENFVFST